MGAARCLPVFPMLCLCVLSAGFRQENTALDLLTDSIVPECAWNLHTWRAQSYCLQVDGVIASHPDTVLTTCDSPFHSHNLLALQFSGCDGKNIGVGHHALLQGIFPTQGSNPHLLHCRQILYPLSHLGTLLSLCLPLNSTTRVTQLTVNLLVADIWFYTISE